MVSKKTLSFSPQPISIRPLSEDEAMKSKVFDNSYRDLGMNRGFLTYLWGTRSGAFGPSSEFGNGRPSEHLHESEVGGHNQVERLLYLKSQSLTLG